MATRENDRHMTHPGAVSRGAYSSLPFEISQSVKDGTYLVGDDFTEEQLTEWFSQEREAFFESDAGNSDEDPWYAYMRYVNELIGFSALAREPRRTSSMLVLGPGSGTEVELFALSHPECRLTFLEASTRFQDELRRRFPRSIIIEPHASGSIELDCETQDVVCAFSVLHHIPNVSKVLSEISRVTRPGGLLLVREPCSSMGDWRFPRSATPNERGISRKLLVDMAVRAGLAAEREPIPVLLEPINSLLKKTIGFRRVPFPLLYWIDRTLSKLASLNDHYWRDSRLKKVGPSSYFYLFRKTGLAMAPRRP